MVYMLQNLHLMFVLRAPSLYFPNSRCRE